MSADFDTVKRQMIKNSEDAPSDMGAKHVIDLKEQIRLNKRLSFNAKADKVVTGALLFLVIPTLLICSFDKNIRRHETVERIGLGLCGLSIGTQIALRRQDHKIGKQLNQLKNEEYARDHV